MCMVLLSEEEKDDYEFIIYNWIFSEKIYKKFRVSEIISYLKSKNIKPDIIEIKDILKNWCDIGLIYSNIDGYRLLTL